MTDERALAASIVKLFGLLAFFGLMYIVLDQVALDFINNLGPTGPDAQTSQVNELQSYMSSMWVYLPAIAIFGYSAHLLARSIFESKGGVR